MALGLGTALLAAVVFGAAALLQATGARRVPTAAGLDAGLVLRLLREPAFVAALVLNVIGFVLHLVAVRLLPLFLAQAGIAVSLAVTALLAVRVFGEPLSAVEWAAVAGVSIGLALLTAAAGEAGDERATGVVIALVGVGVLLVAVAGALATRRQGTVSTALLSALAGLGFAASAISARILPELSFSGVVSSPATYLLLAAGGLAFLLYSVALQRGSVTAATAPMIVLQTLTPSLVGVLALGDSVRTGWLAAAAAGLVSTVVGAVVLARYDGLRERRRATEARSAGETSGRSSLRVEGPDS